MNYFTETGVKKTVTNSYALSKIKKETLLFMMLHNFLMFNFILLK